jgi:hypothetical protein
MGSESHLNVYRSCAPVVDTSFDGAGEETVVGAVVDAIAEAEGVDSTEIEPLYDVVDLDALSRLFDERNGTDSSDALLTFRIDTWNVFVRADGRIRVCDGTRRTDPAPVFDEPTV